MRKPLWITKSGPYKVVSYAHSYLIVKPSWGQYAEVWNAEDGGEPAFWQRLRLADNLERGLNSSYSTDEIRQAERRIAEHDRNLAEAQQ